ncbi:gamma-tubulin complex component 5 [Drosophila montana]|uniref:gamma-tubulin complex component 5 n=1 Tax=Drosophila montana TaxID=40370 RepID=UPI00313D32DA
MSEDPRNEAVLQNVEKLVKCLAGAGFTTSERRSLMQYAVHKIRNHRFLSTNSHQVRRSIDNMVERFHYEGMLNQAEAVRHLSTLIMNHESWREHYEVDVQYSLLDFLVHMTHEPIQTMRRNRNRMHERLLAIRDALKTAPDTDEPKELPQPNLAETDIDWVALLSKDFITLPSESYGSDSSLSDWTDETSSEESAQYEEPQDSKTSLDQKNMAEVYAKSQNYPSGTNTFVPLPQPTAGRPKKVFRITQPMSISFSGIQTRPNWCTLPKLPALQPPQKQMPYIYSIFDANHLARTIHAHWWRQDIKIHTLTPTNDACANFAISHVQHLNRHVRGLLRHSLPNTVTETCLLREIIFMFFEPANCCFFEVQPEQRTQMQMQIKVRPNVSICSVSSGLLKSTLEDEVLPAVRAMHQLRQLIKELTLPTSYMPSTGTLECFAVGLRDFIQPIVQRLLAFERRLLDKAAGKPESNLTLIYFIRHMYEEFQQLHQLQLLASDAVVQAPPHLRSAYLLTQLYKHTRVHVPHQKMATALLLIALKRYCDISDNWWRHAQLADCRDEYIVEFCREDWVAAGQGIRERCLPPDADASHQAILDELQGCAFYKLLITYALESGETQDLLASIGLLGDLVNTSQQLGPLHSDLTKQLFNELQSFGSGGVHPVGRRRASVQELARLELKQHDEQLLKTTDKLGNTEIMGLFTQHIRRAYDQQVHMEQTTPPVQLLDIIEALEQCTTLKLPQLLPRALGRVLRQRCDLANVYVMRWYRDELLLGDHVRFLRHILMLEADYLMYPFYTSLFRQIESGQRWARSSQLTTELYDILDAHYPSMACELYVELISQSRSQSSKVYEALDAIGMVYIMPPALSRIITDKHMAYYNNIWRLMLKVKWAAWKLENMHFIRREPNDVYGPLDLLGLTVRRLEMLRFWLIYLINSLHTHLCTHVMQAIGGQFDEQLKKIGTIRELAKLHHEYLMCLANHCLLTEDFEEFRTALEQIFHLVFVLDMEWNSCGNYLNASHALSLDMSSEYDDLSLDETTNLDINECTKAMEYLALNQVGEIEGTYIRCHQMLGSILTALVYKHDYKFLNSLEVAINSSLPC